MDPIAHSFVLDAKSSLQALAGHEQQIRTYVNERQLNFGILFNLREIRVYRRGQKGHDSDLSFQLLPLWELAIGESLVADPHLGRFEAFAATFAYREMGREERINLIRDAEPWLDREASGDPIRVDIDFLVEQLRKLSGELASDAALRTDDLKRHLKLKPGHEKAMRGELEALSQDLAPGTDPGSLPDRVEDYAASTEGLAQRIWRQYLLRVAQLALARIVLYRAWEDVGFVDDYLYDGGFGQIYDRLDRNLRQVLDEAFARARKKYWWLYGAENNYDWYRPSDDALTDVLYALTPFPLGKLDADVLGGLYESYVDEIDRDRLGQFWTPRSVVRLMLDRGGFEGPGGVFRLEGDERRPRKVFDFATGSGGFLVEAARRMIDQGGISDDDPEGLDETLASIVSGLHGCEISPFPYYLTEINLLLQVSRLLGKMAMIGRDPPSSFALSLVHVDTLTSRAAVTESLEDFEAEHRADEAKLAEDERFGLVPLDPEKQAAFDRIREPESFDLVVGNPPYVFEANNRLLFERLRQIPAWKSVYRGKSDYLYYFLYLAVEKVAPGGRLCVITPAGWMNAGNADWLREHVAGKLHLDELYLFGSYRLFAPEREARRRQHRAPTPTVESAILIATKAKPRKGHKLRVIALEDESEAANALAPDPDARTPDRDLLLAEMARRVRGRPGRKNGIHVHDVVQADLVHFRPWPIKHAAEDVAARAVAHLQQALDDPDSTVERLGDRWSIPQGVQTGADAYTRRIERRLERSFPEVKHRLDAAGARIGEPIMELPAGAEKEAPWSDHPEVLARSIEPGAILYAAMDEAMYTSLVWLGREDEAPRAVVDGLERWKPVLESRAEFKRNPKRRWWETAWPRDKVELRRPKVISLYRTDRGRFAVDEAGNWQPSIKTTLVIPKKDGLSVAYVCGLLNSELLDLWYSIRGKIPRDVWRNYEPKPMAEIPYRQVGGIGAADDERLAELERALGEKSWEAASALADAIGADALRAEGGDAAAAAALEQLVRAIAANRRNLLPFRDRFPELSRRVKDPWCAGVISFDLGPFAANLPASKTVSVRIDPDLTLSIETEGVLGRGKLSEGALVFTRQRKVTARVEGPGERLALLERLLEGQSRLLGDELRETALPRDLGAIEEDVEAARSEVEELLAAGQVLVEAAERLVCRLFGIPRDLEDEVVAHALARAKTSSSAPAEQSD